MKKILFSFLLTLLSLVSGAGSVLDPAQLSGFRLGASFSEDSEFEHENLTWRPNTGFVSRYWPNRTGSTLFTTNDALYSVAYQQGCPVVFSDVPYFYENARVSTLTTDPVIYQFGTEPTVGSSGVYFDAIMAFPAFLYGDENKPTVDQDAAVGVYLQYLDVSASAVGLFVVARDWSGVARHFNCRTVTISVDADGFYRCRLVIRLINNINKTGSVRQGLMVSAYDYLQCSDARIPDYATVRDDLQEYARYGYIFSPLKPIGSGLSKATIGGSVALAMHALTHADPFTATYTWDAGMFKEVTIDGISASEDELSACRVVRDLKGSINSTISWRGKNGYSDGETTTSMQSGFIFHVGNSMVQTGRVEYAGTRYTYVADAVAAAEAWEGDERTMTLLSDIDGDISITNGLSSELTLALNGKTVYGSLRHGTPKAISFGTLLIDWYPSYSGTVVGPFVCHNTAVTINGGYFIGPASFSNAYVTAENVGVSPVFGNTVSFQFSDIELSGGALFDSGIHFNEPVTVSEAASFQINAATFQKGLVVSTATGVPVVINGGDFRGTTSIQTGGTAITYIRGGRFHGKLCFSDSNAHVISGGQFRKSENAELIEHVVFPTGKTFVDYDTEYWMVGDIPTNAVESVTR